MAGTHIMLIEKLWSLKRQIDKGACPSIPYVHLNTLLREPAYRTDVLRRAANDGNRELKALAQEILSEDSGLPLTAKTDSASLDNAAPAKPSRPERKTRRNLLALIPVVAAGGAAVVGFTTFENRAIRVSADITSDTVWETGNRYILENTVFVDGANLTIQPGVTIEGERDSALIVTRTSQLFARGQADQPIVFTSSQPEGSRARGDWGGLVLLGKAPVNQPAATIEGLDQNDPRGHFGGDDPNDSCGVLEYTRIEFAGFEVYQDNELNGLTLGGCGRSTIVRNVQVHRSLDDGIEMFGGTVDLKNVVVSGAGDDGIDWDWGWTGRVQFAVIQQHPDVGDNAFEGDNNGDDHDALPRSEPTFYNVTLAGAGLAPRQHRAIVVREGSGGHFHNMIIDSYAIEAIDVRDNAAAQSRQGQLTFANNLLANTGQLGRSPEEQGDGNDDFGFSENNWLRAPDSNNFFRTDSALHDSARNLLTPSFGSRVQMRQMHAAEPPESEFFDESAVFQGAINPLATRSWLSGWTRFPDA